MGSCSGLHGDFSRRKLHGLKPLHRDPRDYLYQSLGADARTQVDLRPWDSPVEAQFQVSSCVGNAVANAYELMVKQRYPDKFENLSRLFIYYNARALEGAQNTDSGAYIRNALQGLKLYGVCKESLWPYDPEKVNVKPTDECYTEAVSRTITEYRLVIDVAGMTQALSDNQPVVFGITIFAGFMWLTPSNAVVAMPSENETDIGAHAMCAVGYDLDKKLFLVKNSFGTDWGDQGYCWIPFDYIERYQSEMWVFTIPKLA